MARRRRFGPVFKRQVVEELLAGAAAVAQLGVPPDRPRELLVDELGHTVANALQHSRQTGIPLAQLARQVAEERYAGRLSQTHRPAGLGAAITRRLARRVPRSYRRREACRQFIEVTRSRFGERN